MFHKILVANRGEIAARIIRTARDSGYGTVAVYSEADADAPHAHLADESVRIGGSRVVDSYLNMDALLEAARLVGADAVHPGYGFLSENDAFARACGDAGLVFIGPPAEAIRLMGNKRVAKDMMMKAGVPCVPGYQGKDQKDSRLLKEAEAVGFPLMLKAAAGGGGRGMRLLEGADGLEDALRSARREAKSAFGSDEMILERAVVNARHVEIQIARDSHGGSVYLGERDCSLQRRHQKVIEEAPAPHFDESLRVQMGEAAVRAAEACDYLGLGTVEFLLGEDGAFYFLEMNTRLQVEHPVTEMITGVDLVDWQLRIASGEALPLRQDAIALRGYAMEARLYAENPAKNFMPQTGRILFWREAEGLGVRTDHGVVSGLEVSPYYDPMLAKVIAHGGTREEARRRLIRALRETRLLGVQTNKNFLIALLSEERFAAGEVSTGFIDAETLERVGRETKPETSDIALAAVLFQSEAGESDSHGALWRWSNSEDLARRVIVNVSDETHEARMISDAPEGEGVRVSIGETDHLIALHEARDSRASFTLDGARQSAFFARDGHDMFLDRGGRVLRFENRTYAPALSEDKEGSGRIVATTEGQVIAISVAEGDRVRRGDTLIVIEAMKMEHRLVADADGVVKALHAEMDSQVKKGALMAELELDGETEKDGEAG